MVEFTAGSSVMEIYHSSGCNSIGEFDQRIVRQSCEIVPQLHTLYACSFVGDGEVFS
jgi:hypothetical protein